MRTSIFLALAAAHGFAVMDLLYLVLIAGLFLLSIHLRDGCHVVVVHGEAEDVGVLPDAVGFVLSGSTGSPFWTAQRSRTCASVTPYFLAMTLNGASACSPSAFIWSVLALPCPAALLQVG